MGGTGGEDPLRSFFFAHLLRPNFFFKSVQICMKDAEFSERGEVDFPRWELSEWPVFLEPVYKYYREETIELNPIYIPMIEWNNLPIFPLKFGTFPYTSYAFVFCNNFHVNSNSIRPFCTTLKSNTNLRYSEHIIFHSKCIP